jgi:hypothetical protein
MLQQAHMQIYQEDNAEKTDIKELNILEFYIEPDCPLTIRPRDAIMLGVRLEFTMEEFFATGGVVSFVDRMAGALGIHRSDMRVAGV